MNVLYSVLRIDDLMYKIIGEIIYIKHNNRVSKVDFTPLPDGMMIEPISYLITKAKRENGQLEVTLRQPLSGIGELTEVIGDFDISNFNEVNVNWKTQQEIEEEKLLESLLPSQEEVEQAEFELKSINLLVELGVLQ